ncbi:MAG: polyprenyl synthetase family protein, partial [Pelagibacterales bacterium]|nr:polyprenyl synthetase family protein [Pelagibacterales bacterium]
MDNDDMRRGKNTLHKQFNEAIAILTGDSLLTDAFYVLTEFYKNKDPKICIELISLLSKSAGSQGMVGGQVLDLFPLENSKENINFMNEMKTGALIKCATLYGAILGKASIKDYNNMESFGIALGKAFQIRDDILDVQGDAQELGKKTNKDKIKGKLSLIDFYGIEGAKKLASNYIIEAKDIISSYGNKGRNLQMLTEYIIDRKK